MKNNGYEPYRLGLVGTTGNDSGVCPICGAKPRNQHTLGQAGKCDWLKRSPKDRSALIAQGAKRDFAGNKVKPQARREEAA